MGGELYNLFGMEEEEDDDGMNDEQTGDSAYGGDGMDGQRKHLPDSSDDEDDGVDWGLYSKMVEESQGFDVPKLPVVVAGQIVPLRDLNGHMEDLIYCCKLAVKHFLDKEGKHLVFVKVLTANVRTISPVVFLYYVTFEAKDSRKQVGVYQAEVCYYFLEKESCEVEIMRSKPKPADGPSSSSGSSCESSPTQDRNFLHQVIVRLKGYRDSLW